MAVSHTQGPVDRAATAATAAPQKYGLQNPNTMVGKIEAISNIFLKAVAFFFYAVFNVVFVLLPLLFDHIINGTKPTVSDTLEPAIDAPAAAVARHIVDVKPLFDEACKAHLRAQFDDIYLAIERAAEKGEFVQIERTTFDLNCPQNFSIKIKNCGDKAFENHKKLDQNGFADKRKGLDDSTDWIPCKSTSAKRTDLLIPPTKEAASNISTYVNMHKKQGWDKLRDAAIREMERLLDSNISATKLTFCTDGFVVDYLHLRFEDIK